MSLRILLSWILVSLTIISFSQYQENLPQARPIPPNAASLFKTMERPIGNFTGTIPISFPLFSVSSGSLSANVSLDYNSSGGIKVEEPGGPIGLGFNLGDGGGRITQLVKDKPDDDVNCGRLYNSVKPSNFSCSSEDNLYTYQQNWLDLEPDVFVYSCNGHSGKFFLKENGDVVMMSQDDVKITYETDYEGIFYWTIIDASGNKFHFDNKIKNESSWSGTYGSTSSSVSSQSWFLTQAVNMNNEDTLTYAYTTTGYDFTTFSGSYWPLNLATLNCMGFNTTGDMGTVTTDGGELLVSRIDGKDGYILFNNEIAYPSGPKRITSIELHNPSGALIKKYRFNYGTSFSSNRSKLINFSEFGSSGTDSLTTKFDYEEFYNLPSTLSTSVDLWGYFNGAGNDYTAQIPNMIETYGFWTAYWDYRAYRHSNGILASANILKKITYPTGGYREIDYEANRALGLGDLFQYHPYDAYMTTRNFSETNFNFSSPYTPCMQHLFTVNSFYGQSKFSFELNNVGFSCSNPIVKIMRLLDSTDLSGGAEYYSFYNAESGSYVLPNGYYRVDVFVEDPYYSCTIDQLTGSWPEGTYDDTTVVTQPYGANANLYKRTYNAPGVRVKQVSDYDPLTAKTNNTEYRYKYYSHDSTVDAGMFVSPVNVTALENVWECECQYVKVTSSPSYPLSADGGSYVVYPEVRTIDNAKGWTDRIYSYAFDTPSESYPAGPPTDYSFYRGNLLYEKTYDKNGTLLKQTSNDWGWETAIPTAPGKKVKCYWYTHTGQGWMDQYYWTDAKPSDPLMILNTMNECTDYEISQSPKVLVQSIDYTYGQGGNQTNETDYDYYMQDGVYYLKKKKQVINGSKTKEQSYKYAFNSNSDFRLGLNSTEQAVKNALNTRHYYLPIEVVDSIRPSGGSPTFLGGSKYLFDSIGNYGARLTKYRGYTTASDSTEINFSAYDSSGNVREQYKTNDIKEVVIWGYNRTYPVARITGSDLSTVLSLINLSVINSPSNDAALSMELNKIRNGLAGSAAQVTTYTYSPLYGMTSMTDPAGRTTYYEYDVFGRLKLVRDQNNYIIKKYEYKMNNPL